MIAQRPYQGPSKLADQGAWDRALARAHGQHARPICVAYHLWLCRSSDGTQVYQVRQRSARPRDLACSCPTDAHLVCKHMAAVAQAVEDLDRMVDLHQIVRERELVGETTSSAHAELALVEHRIAQRNAWFEQEQVAINDLLDSLDGMDPAVFEDSYHLDAHTQHMLDAILGAEQIELSEEEIALLATQQEETKPTESDELGEALRQQLEDSLNEPDALYLAFHEPWI
jgi:hypothetical protein